MRPRIIKALHVSGAAAADVPALSELVGIAEATVVNGLVIDLKDETGRIYYDSNIETATRAGAVMNWFSLSEVLSEAALHDLYVIGRIVAFMDPIAPEAYPSMAVWDQRRDAPFQLNGQHYLDPSDEGARGYALDLAVEACRAGVDEIQFDQLAYPVGIDRETLFDGGATEEDRVGAVRTFLAEASTRLGREGCALAADVFGFTTSINHDGGIGQNFRQLSEVTDVLSPTLYPSSYSEGWFGLDDPSSRPGRVVGLALDDGLERIAGPAVLRPWLQDFSYGVDGVRAQIAAAEERGLGWMLWNVQSQFTTGALDAARDEGTGGPG